MRPKDYFCRIIVALVIGMSSSCFFLEIPDPVDFQKSIGVYQKNCDTVCEYVILKQDSTYIHVKRGETDSLTHCGKFEVSTKRITDIRFYGYDNFDDSHVDVSWDGVCDLILFSNAIVNNFDSYYTEHDYFKLYNPALDNSFHPDTVPINLNACGFYLSADYNKESLNYIIVNDDGSYTHRYISVSDTLCHTGSWLFLQVRESWWYTQNYILFHNWYSYGIERNYYLKTYGGDRVAKINSREIDLEPGLSQLTFFKYKSIDGLMSRRWGDFLTEDSQKYLQDSVFSSFQM